MSGLSAQEIKGVFTSSVFGGRAQRSLAMAGFLSKDELATLVKGAVKNSFIAGGPAGDHAVSGIAIGDQLRSVHSLDVAQAEHAVHSHPNTLAAAALQGADLAAVQADHATGARHTLTNVNNAAAQAHTRTWAVAALTSEFSIGAGKISNPGGTDTTGKVLVVVWEDWTP